MLLGNKTRQFDSAALTGVACPGALLVCAVSPQGAGTPSAAGWVWMCLRDAENFGKALLRD